MKHIRIVALGVFVFSFSGCFDGTQARSLASVNPSVAHKQADATSQLARLESGVRELNRLDATRWCGLAWHPPETVEARVGGRPCHLARDLVSRALMLQDIIDAAARAYADVQPHDIRCTDLAGHELAFQGLPAFRDVVLHGVACRINRNIIGPLITFDEDPNERYPLPELPPVLGPAPQPDPPASPSRVR